MTSERTAEGWVLRVKPEGVTRFGGALFLCVWLCGWAFGEVAVLSILIGGAYALLSGNPELASKIKGIPPGPAFGVGAFMLVWLAGWTFGGIAAITELLRLVSSEDTLTIDPTGVTIRHRRGPFSWTHRVAREEIRNVRVSTRHRTLSLETGKKAIEFAPLPTPADATAALEALRRELRLPGAQEPGSALPEGWEETISPEGDRVILPSLRTRRHQMLVLAAIAAALWLLTLFLAWLAMSGQHTLGAAIGVGVLAALFAAGALWLDRTHSEIKLGSGRVTCRRRYGKVARDVFQVDRLELTTKTDSDGDAWYKLEGVSLGPTDPRRPGRPRRRTLAQALHDPFVPKALGAWLATHASVTYWDHGHPA